MSYNYKTNWLIVDPSIRIQNYTSLGETSLEPRLGVKYNINEYCRLKGSFGLFSQNLILFIGTITCLFASCVAFFQNDIKRIIAYSTCSQLGYMFMAVGVSAYSVAYFHLLSHAFFKALLFLGAGSVIHAMHHEQDIRNF